MKKLVFLGLILAMGNIAMGDVTEILKESTIEDPKPTTKVVNGTGYLPITARGDVVNVNNKIYLRVKPISNIGPDGSSLFFDFGQLTAGSESTLSGQFTAEVIKNSKGSENYVKIKDTPGKKAITIAFDKGDGTGSSGNETTITSDITIAPHSGTEQGGAGTAMTVGHADYSLTSSYEGLSKFIGNVQVDIRMDGANKDEGTGVFIDKTKRIAITVEQLNEITVDESREVEKVTRKD